MSDVATALRIQEATKDSMFAPEIMFTAAQLYQTALHNPSEDELQELVFKYSALLSAHVATRVTSILLTESQFDQMINDINEFDKIAKDVLSE